MSCQRACEIWFATDAKWYMMLGNFEHAYDAEDCTFYGPFTSEQAVDQFLSRNFSNPGGSSTDDTGTCPPPENPVRLLRPNRW